MIIRHGCGSIFLLFLVLAPTTLLANGLLPALNAFRSDTAFAFLFACIVLIESLVIRLGLRRIHLVDVLWRVILVNAASSYAGYLFMRSPLMPDYTEVWRQAIPFFIWTLCVELPLAFLLLMRMQHQPWKKLGLVLASNVFSYIFLVTAEKPGTALWLENRNVADRAVLAGWSNPSMMAESAGIIYGTESGRGSVAHRLRYFDFKENRWISMTNCPPIDPRYWDVEGDVAGFLIKDEIDERRMDIVIRQLPDFRLIVKIPGTNAPYHISSWSLKISPDRKKVAALIPLHEIRKPDRKGSYQILGSVCAVKVFEIGTGQLLGVSPRKAVSEPWWTPDSRRVLFNSIRDDGLLELTEVGKQQVNHRAADKFFDAPTFAYDWSTGSVDYFGEMKSAHLAADAGLLACRSEPDGVKLLDPETGQQRVVRIGKLGLRDIIVSPDGKRAIVSLVLSHPLAYMGYATIVDLENPERRHFIDTFDYRLDWTR